MRNDRAAKTKSGSIAACSLYKETGMRRLKKITGILSVIALSIAFKAPVTYLTTPEEERPDIAEAFDIEDEVMATERQIAWDEFPRRIDRLVEVPGTSTQVPIVQATPDAPNAYLYPLQGCNEARRIWHVLHRLRMHAGVIFRHRLRAPDVRRQCIRGHRKLHR